MLFSIITVCRNSKKTIERTFRSLLAQSCDDYEYWVIDGGSTDGTLELIRQYEPQFRGRMHWVSEPDKGIYDAMNKGIAAGTGNFLYFLNSDDYFEKETLAKTAQAISEHPLSKVFLGFVRSVSEDGTEFDVRRGHCSSLLEGPICHQSIFMHRELFQKYGCFDLEFSVSADYELEMRLWKNGIPFEPLDFIVANFTRGGFGTSNFFRNWDEKSKIMLRYHFVTPYEYKRRKIFRKLYEFCCLFWSALHFKRGTK